MLAAFGDETLVRAALDFEAALARASAAEGLIAPEAAQVIAEACADISFDIAELAGEAAHAGTLAIPLVRRLREHLAARNPDVAAARASGRHQPGPRRHRPDAAGQGRRRADRF